MRYPSGSRRLALICSVSYLFDSRGFFGERGGTRTLDPMIKSRASRSLDRVWVRWARTCLTPHERHQLRRKREYLRVIIVIAGAAGCGTSIAPNGSQRDTLRPADLFRIEVPFFQASSYRERRSSAPIVSHRLDAPDNRALFLLGIPRPRAARHIADGTACGAWVHLCLRRQTQGSRACCYRPRFAFGHRQ